MIKSKILITGISGLIGSALVEQLKGKYEIIGIDKEAGPKTSPGVSLYECDLTHRESIEQCLDQIHANHGNHLASVVHLAAYYDFSGDPSPLYERLTINGTQNLLRKLNEVFVVEQFIFSSTLLVMKPTHPGEGEISESSKIQPTWAYPQSKLEAEEVIENERGTIPTLILRIAGVYDENGHSPTLTQQIKRIYDRSFESHFYPGDREAGQAFIHIQDLAELVEHCIERRFLMEEYDVYLVAEPDVMSYEEIQNCVGKIIYQKEWTTLRIPKPIAKAGAWLKDKVGEEEFIQPWMIDMADAHYAVDIEKAQQAFDWIPQHRLRETLPEMVKRLMKAPKQWHEENGIPYENNSKSDRELSRRS